MNASASNVENFWRKCQHIFTHFKFPYENCFPDKNLNLCSYIILFLLQWQVYGITKKFVKKWTKIQSWAENIVGISRISMNFLFSNPIKFYLQRPNYGSFIWLCFWMIEKNLIKNVVFLQYLIGGFDDSVTSPLLK